MFSSFTSRIYCMHVHNERKPAGEHAFATFHSSHTKTNLKRDRKRREKITLYDSVVCHAQPPYLHSVVTGKNSRAIPAEKKQQQKQLHERFLLLRETSLRDRVVPSGAARVGRQSQERTKQKKHTLIPEPVKDPPYGEPMEGTPRY